jgi:hypothetical protein
MCKYPDYFEWYHSIKQKPSKIAALLGKPRKANENADFKDDKILWPKFLDRLLGQYESRLDRVRRHVRVPYDKYLEFEELDARNVREGDDSARTRAFSDRVKQAIARLKAICGVVDDNHGNANTDDGSDEHEDGENGDGGEADASTSDGNTDDDEDRDDKKPGSTQPVQNGSGSPEL